MDAGKTLTPEESFDIITQAIKKTKENIRENSFCFLLWGWLIAAASFSDFLLQHYTSFRYYFVPFPVLTIIGIIVTIILFVKKNSGHTVSYTNYFVSKLWAILGICFIVVVFINVSQGKAPFTYTLIIAGIGTLVSGWVMKFRPLILGGILFLAAAIVSIYVTDDYKPLMHGFAVITGYLIPGYLLKNAKDNN